MPDLAENKTEDEFSDLDDDLELMENLEGAAASLDEDDSRALEQLERAPETRLYRKAMESPLPVKQALAFLAAVELDETRKPEEQIGLRPLFKACLEHGGPAWLNPAKYISRLHNTVLSYSGPHRIITPFVDLLLELAQKGISPAAFCRYVIAPRMFQDYDWRNWERNHLGSLRRIAELLLELREQAPFNQEKIRTAFLTLARDIVLVKYIGRPLARIPELQLADESAMEAYKRAWAGIELKHSFFLYFMKRNLLPLLYWMSGRVALSTLTELVSRMPGLETTFEQEYPEELFALTPGDPPLHLYAANYEASLQSRRVRNFRFHDFIREMNAYLDMIHGLLRTRNGLHVCSYYAGRLNRAQSPELAELLRDLADVLIDRRGLHYYVWHLRRMMKRDPGDRRAYLDFLSNNQGCDPEYPDIAAIFAADPFDDHTEMADMARMLGLDPEQDLGPPPPGMGGDPNYGMDIIVQERLTTRDGETPRPFRELLDAYLRKNPDQKPLIDRCVDDVINGRDRHWPDSMDRELDECGPPLHPVIMRALIPGLGQFFSSNVKSDGFRSLRKLYGRANELPELNERVDFRMPVREEMSLDRLKEQEVRRQINLEKAGVVWKYLSENFDSASDSGARRLGAMLLELRRVLENKEAPVIEKERRLTKLRGGTEEIRDDRGRILTSEEIAGEIAELDKQVKKERKPIGFIRDKVERLNSLGEMFPDLSEEQRVISILLVASSEGKAGSDEQRFAFSFLYERYREIPAIAERMDYLRGDVVMEMLDIRQFDFIINVLDLLNQYLMRDETISGAARGDGSEAHKEWTALLKPYVRTRGGKVGMESVEAAYRNIVMLGKLNAERARWKEILSRIEEGDTKYFRSLSLIASKSFIDSYYGDMGGTCLSNTPQAINDKGFYNIRLADRDGRNIIGQGLLKFSAEGIRSRGIQRFCFAFSFNPLESYLARLGRNQQLYIYLQYRRLLESLARRWKVPIVIPGVDFYGIISNHSALESLITRYEQHRNAVLVKDARGLSLMYEEIYYARAMIIIQPDKSTTFGARADMEKLLPGAAGAI